MNQGYLEASGHNWVEVGINCVISRIAHMLTTCPLSQGQGSGPRIDKQDEEEKEYFDAMGNKARDDLSRM